MSRLSMVASVTFSSARNVRSSTAPFRTFFSFVRTNAPPFPGFTCWNSTTVTSPSGRLRAMPFFKSLVEMLMTGSQDEILGGQGERFAAVRTDDERVLDAYPADAGQVDAGFDGDDVATQQRIIGRRRDPWRFVDFEADAVPGRMRERVGPSRLRDHIARRLVDVGAPHVDRDTFTARLLAGEHDLVDV